MSGISSGDYYRIAQVDGALAFNMLLGETQELVSNSAMAGLRGLRESMGTGAEISDLSRQLEQVKSSLDAAVRAEENNRFSPAGQDVTLAVANAVDTSLRSLTGGVLDSANGAVDLANDAADNGGSAAARAKEAAALNKQAADDLAAGDSQAGRTGATSALLEAGLAVAEAQEEVAAATELRNEARDRLGDLDADLEAARNADQPNPESIASLTKERDAALVSLNAAEQTVASAQSVEAAVQAVEGAAQDTLALANAPIALIDSENPTVFDLDNGYALSAWGDSGFWTLTDANGEGIIVSPDGQVDPLDGSGEGWQFSNTSTFVLPDGAKITVTPGSSAFLQVTRGNALLEFSDLAPGASPSVNGPRKGGRAADGQQNDGHIFTTTGAGSQWKSGSSLLGAAGNREQVATDPIENELKIDSLDVEIPEEVVAYLGRFGFDLGAYDHDGDGKLNAQELALVVEFLAAAAESVSDLHRKVLAGTAEGVAALFELNLFLEGLMRDVDESQQERRNLSAEEAAVADSIIERLNAAFAGLGTIQPSSFPALPLPPGNRAATGPSGQIADLPSPSGNRAAVLPQGLETIIEEASGLGAAEVASRLVAALEQSGVGPVTEPDLLAENIADLLTGLAKGGLGADESGNLIGALAVLLSRASLDDGAGGGLAGQLASLLSAASVDGALPPVGVSGTLSPLPSPSGNRAAVLPPELAAIIGEASGLGPAEVASRLVSALGQSGVRPETETDLLAEQIAARLTGLAKGGLEAGESGNLIGELAVLLSRAAGSGELGNAVRGAMAGQIADLLESRLGGALSPGTVGELAGQISGILAMAALDGDISMGSLSGKVAGLLGSVAGEAGLTGDAVAATSREAAAFLPRILAAGALPNGGLVAFIPALVTAISEGKGAAGAGEVAQNTDGDISVNALRRAGRLISGFSLNPRAESLAQAFKEQPSEAAGVSGGAGAPPAAIGGPDPGPVASPGDIFFGSSDILEIIENLETDEELLERVRRNLDAATQSQRELLGQAENVFVMARETVEKFFSLVSDSQLLQEVVFADDLSEVDKEMFIGKMNDLYRSWGIEWGGSEDGGPRTPEVEAQLVNKAVSSGMMI